MEPHCHLEGSRGTPWPSIGVSWNPMAIQRGLVEPHGHPEGSHGTRGHPEGSHGTLWPPRGVSWNPVATQRGLVEPRGHPEGSRVVDPLFRCHCRWIQRRSRGTPWPPRGELVHFESFLCLSLQTTASINKHQLEGATTTGLRNT